MGFRGAEKASKMECINNHKQNNLRCLPRLKKGFLSRDYNLGLTLWTMDLQLNTLIFVIWGLFLCHLFVWGLWLAGIAKGQYTPFSTHMRFPKPLNMVTSFGNKIMTSYEIGGFDERGKNNNSVLFHLAYFRNFKDLSGDFKACERWTSENFYG